MTIPPWQKKCSLPTFPKGKQHGIIDLILLIHQKGNPENVVYTDDIGYNSKPLTILCHVVYAMLGIIIPILFPTTFWLLIFSDLNTHRSFPDFAEYVGFFSTYSAGK